MHIEEPKLQVVLITGMSGSGKSVTLHALEDTGFFCVDNLPPELLLPFVTLERQHNASRVAIAMDARNASALPLLPAQLTLLKEQGHHGEITVSGCHHRDPGAPLLRNAPAPPPVAIRIRPVSRRAAPRVGRRD